MLNVLEVIVSNNETVVRCAKDDMIVALEFPPCGLCVAMMCVVTSANAAPDDFVSVQDGAHTFIVSHDGARLKDLVITRAPIVEVSTCSSFQVASCSVQVQLSYFYCPDRTIPYVEEFLGNFLQTLSSHVGAPNKSSSVHMVVVCPELCPGGVAGWSAVELNNGIASAAGQTIVLSFHLVRRAFEEGTASSRGKRHNARIHFAANVVASLYHFSPSRSLSIAFSLLGRSCRASMWSQLPVLPVPIGGSKFKHWSASDVRLPLLDVVRSSIISTYTPSPEEMTDRRVAQQVEKAIVLRRPVCTLALKHSVTTSPLGLSWIRCEIVSTVQAGTDLEHPFRLPPVQVPLFLVVCVAEGDSIVNCDVVEVQVLVAPHFSQLNQCEPPQTTRTEFSWASQLITSFTSRVEVLLVIDPFYSCPGIEFYQVSRAVGKLAEQAEGLGKPFVAMLLKLHAQQEHNRSQLKTITSSAVLEVAAALENSALSLFDVRVPRLAALAVMLLAEHEVDEPARTSLVKALRTLRPSPLLCPTARFFGSMDDAAIELDFEER